MGMIDQYIYDGSFEGFLTAVFEVYDRKPIRVKIVSERLVTVNFFDEEHTIYTDQAKSDRVWKGIEDKIGKKAGNLIYKAFLSEQSDREQVLLRIIKKGFKGENVTDNFADIDVLRLTNLVKIVGREKHRMDAFIRFRLTKDNVYFAEVEPDFDTLPLNAIHFKNRYADQKWLIYDRCRNYGIFYDLKTVTYVKLEISNDINSSLAAPFYFTHDEMHYQDLWKNYFKSTNIPSRKNMRLHLQHLPKRYWKYLSEKQP